MTFRDRHPFILADGRRFCSLLSAAQSLQVSGPRGSHVTEEWRIGKDTWHQQPISYDMAMAALRQAEKDEAAEQARNPLGLHGGGE